VCVSSYTSSTNSQGARAAALEHTSAYVSIRQHTSHTSSMQTARALVLPRWSIRQHTSAFVSIRRIRQVCKQPGRSCCRAGAYVSIRQHTSAYVAYVKYANSQGARAAALEHTSAYVSIRRIRQVCKQPGRSCWPRWTYLKQ
jgi:hypothetical protein